LADASLAIVGDAIRCNFANLPIRATTTGFCAAIDIDFLAVFDAIVSRWRHASASRADETFTVGGLATEVGVRTRRAARSAVYVRLKVVLDSVFAGCRWRRRLSGRRGAAAR
jgi:hypothetical protein